jgi:hypothetical protein
MYLGVYAYAFGVAIVGLGIGFWLQEKLVETNQIISIPSAFNAKDSAPAIRQSGNVPAH